MKRTYFRFALICFTALSLFCIPALSFFSFPSSDDFSFFMDLSKCSVWEHSINMYRNWDGRSLSIPAIVQFFLLKFCSTEASVLVWSCSFLVNIFLLLKIIVLESNIVIKSKKYFFLLYGLLAVMIWLSFYSHISQTVYWATGGSYSLMATFALTWVYLILKISRADKPIGLQIKLLLVLLSFFAGTLSQNLTPALFVLVSIFFLQRTDNSKLKLYVLITLFLLVGAVLLYLAPGNFKRAQYGPNTFDFNFLKIMYHLVYTILFNCRISIVLVITSIIFSALLLSDTTTTKKTDPNPQKSIQTEIIFVVIHNKWLYVMLASLIIFIVVPDFISNRTSIFFMFFAFLFILTSVAGLRHTAWTKSFLHFFNNESVKNKLMIATHVLFISIMVYHFDAAIQMNKELDERNKQLRSSNNRGRDLCIQPIKKNIPFALEFYEIKNDSTYWINKCIAQYYGLRTLKLCE